jgi:hypothetical protein
MDILKTALDRIQLTIPPEVLQQAFKDDIQNWRSAPTSLQDRIMEKVIRHRVLKDANLVGGQEVIISLDDLSPKWSDSISVIYEIPPQRTNNREIMSILSIGYMPLMSVFSSVGNGIGTLNPAQMTDVGSSGQRLGDSSANIPIVSNALVDLIGYNTILIRDSVRVSNAYQVRCVLANENRMGNINPRSYITFAKLCVHAVKSYIYNTMIVKIDQAYLSGGQELGAFKNIVESYSDSEDQYETFLKEVWQKVSFMNDAPAFKRFMTIQINPGL